MKYETMLDVSKYVSPLIGRKCEGSEDDVLFCIDNAMDEAKEIIQRAADEAGVELPD